jgi:hypothetical protein
LVSLRGSLYAGSAVPRFSAAVYNDRVGRPSTEKILVFAVVAAAIFVVGLRLFINSVTTSSRKKALAAVEAEVQSRESAGPSMLDAAAVVATSFAHHVGAGRFAPAYPLFSAPYRSAVSPAAFAKACQASPFLAGARAVTLNQLRRQSVGNAATIEASGLLDSGAGAVAISFVFLEEQGGLRILVLSLAGVPVLQGVAPTRPEGRRPGT